MDISPPVISTGPKGSQFYLIPREQTTHSLDSCGTKLACRASSALTKPDEQLFNVSKSIQSTKVDIQEKGFEELAETRPNIPGSLSSIVVNNALRTSLNQADGVLKNEKTIAQAVKDGAGDVSVGVVSAGAGKIVGELCLFGISRLGHRSPHFVAVTAVASEFVTTQAVYYFLEKKRQEIMNTKPF